MLARRHDGGHGPIFLELTFAAMAGFDEAGRDADEQNTVFAVCCAELCDGHVQCCLAYGIGRRVVNVELGDQVLVCHSGRNGDDLLCASLEDQREENVDQVDVADDVGLERV